MLLRTLQRVAAQHSWRYFAQLGSLCDHATAASVLPHVNGCGLGTLKPLLGDPFFRSVSFSGPRLFSSDGSSSDSHKNESAQAQGELSSAGAVGSEESDPAGAQTVTQSEDTSVAADAPSDGTSEVRM